MNPSFNLHNQIPITQVPDSFLGLRPIQMNATTNTDWTPDRVNRLLNSLDTAETQVITRRTRGGSKPTVSIPEIVQFVCQEKAKHKKIHGHQIRKALEEQVMFRSLRIPSVSTINRIARDHEKEIDQLRIQYEVSVGCHVKSINIPFSTVI
ncbi:Paired box protein Pax-6 [Thelohanellus kitauei]|uniref:Paired box protein Pax-6 n=1 Tax=Thelohanellus kitauei TaxID=669202 RepID=A0A0C2M8W0_THEKT|nr:Paired box protein Pax-6 [Thelohanellus kitauei]